MPGRDAEGLRPSGRPIRSQNSGQYLVGCSIVRYSQRPSAVLNAPMSGLPGEPCAGEGGAAALEAALRIRPTWLNRGPETPGPGRLGNQCNACGVGGARAACAVLLDAINVKVRDGKVANRPIYVALAVAVEGTRDILGLWAGPFPIYITPGESPAG